MKRRDFFKLLGSGSALLALPKSALAKLLDNSAWKTYRLTYSIQLPETSPTAKLWLPVPYISGADYQQSILHTWTGNADKATIHVMRNYTTPVFYAQWDKAGTRDISFSSVVKTTDRRSDFSRKQSSTGSYASDARAFLSASTHVPTDGIVYATAQSICNGVKDPLEKAYAIYNWIIDNSFRDPQVQGCGTGDIKAMLESGNLGGKCVDINSLFVGLSRAVGIPSREIFGIRVGESKVSPSLGKAGNVTKAQHCRAEFYIPKLGWVPCDPADVRKAILEEKLTLADKHIQQLRQRFFNSWEMNWVGFNYARDFKLQPNSDRVMNFLMYPQADIDGKLRDSLNPQNFTYQITSEQLA